MADRLPLILNLARQTASAGLLLVLAACGGKPAGTAPSGSTTSTAYKPSSDFDETIDLAGSDEIVSLGRLGKDRIALSTKSGLGYVADVDGGSLKDVKPAFKHDAANSTIFMASEKFVWVLYQGDGMVGRNRTELDGSGKLDISKVAVDDLVDDADDLTVLAATPDQFFAVDDANLYVFTFAGEQVQRKKISLPGQAFGDKEYPLGAGSMGDDAKVWLVTTKRLLRFTSDWQSEAVFFGKDGDLPTRVSLHLKDEAAAPEGIVGLYDDNRLRTLGHASSDAKKKASQKSDEDDQ